MMERRPPMLRMLVILAMLLTWAPGALAQQPSPKAPKLPGVGDPEKEFEKFWEYDETDETCDSKIWTRIFKKAFVVTGETDGGEFPSEMVRHSCNQQCKGGTHAHDGCKAGECYVAHDHDKDPGIPLTWEEKQTDEVVKKISANIQAKLGKAISGGIGYEEQIKKLIEKAAKRELRVRGCDVKEPCAVKTVAGGFLLTVNPGKVIVKGYHVYKSQFTCDGYGHKFYPDCWICVPKRHLGQWYETEITSIEFMAGVSTTFTTWLLPGTTCNCRPGTATGGGSSTGGTGNDRSPGTRGHDGGGQGGTGDTEPDRGGNRGGQGGSDGREPPRKPAPPQGGNRCCSSTVR
jgi:hypothetical protein